MFGIPSRLFLVNRPEFFHANRNWLDGHNLNVLAAPDIVCNQNQYQLCFQKPVLRTEGFVSESANSVISAQKLVGERRLRRQAWKAEDAAKSRLRTLNVRASDRNYGSMMKSGQQDTAERLSNPWLRWRPTAIIAGLVRRSDSNQDRYFSRSPGMIVSARSEILIMPMNSPTTMYESLLLNSQGFADKALINQLFDITTTPTESEAIHFSDDDEYSNDDEWGEDDDFSEYWN